MLLITYLNKTKYPIEVKRSAYVIFRLESGNGKNGINNNFVGIQADGSKWPSKYDSVIIGTTIMNENMTGRARRFVVFDKWQSGIDMFIDRLQARGIFIGGKPTRIFKQDVLSITDLALCYYHEWVYGAKLFVKEKDMIDFMFMYNQSVKLIS